jgi:hypothetical protein
LAHPTQQKPTNSSEKQKVMLPCGFATPPQALMPKPCSRRSAASREPRRLRIVAMAPDSFNYQEIAETEGLSRYGSPQIVAESLKPSDRDTAREPLSLSNEPPEHIPPPTAETTPPTAPGERAEISPSLAPALASS